MGGTPLDPVNSEKESKPQIQQTKEK